MDGWNPEEFEAEISRRLEEEHKRRAEEKAAQTEVASTEEDFSLAPLPETDNDMTVSETTSAGEETPVSPVTSASTEVSSEEAPPVRIKTAYDPVQVKAVIRMKYLLHTLFLFHDSTVKIRNYFT